MGPFPSFRFRDPECVGHEVAAVQPDVLAAETHRRADWTVVGIA
jgi:hypothetical protein